MEYSQWRSSVVHCSSLRGTNPTAAATLEAASEEKCRLKDGLHIQIRKVSCGAGIEEAAQVDGVGRCGDTYSIA